MEAEKANGGRMAVGTVRELLPQATFRLEMEDRSQVVAHPAGAREVNFVRLRPGDRVEVQLSPHDRSRGRILRLLED
jgi:translation initiation factor IF-1